MEALPTPESDNTLTVWYDFEGDFLNSGSVPDRSGNGYDHSDRPVSIRGISGNQAILFSEWIYSCPK